MDLNNLYSITRTGVDNPTNTGDPRDEFQRDFDRIIFSSSFRRLQNKTQVFPLPGSVFVHNRLTHSLEVTSVGRSLGSLVGKHIVSTYKNELNEESKDFYRNSLYNVVASACLCHDIGNPAFGHSGEDAISSYFEKNEATLSSYFEKAQWADFVNFEGNANAMRILTQQQKGKSEGGLKLTSSTLACIAKYPCESIGKDKDFIYRKKFGFFQTEKKTFIDIAENTAMIKDDSEPLIYFRHPFVWLVEAADDICYNIIDLEDAHRLGIVDHGFCIDTLLRLISCIGTDQLEILKNQVHAINDKNDKISYLRAKSINALIMRSVEIYKENFLKVTSGTLKKPLFDLVKEECDALKAITEYSKKNIYNHRSVVEIENAGYNVMYELLSHFVPPILKEKSTRKKSDDKAIQLIPQQFLYNDDSPYVNVMGILDYVSGMTDNYATDLYRRIKGIDIGMTL